MTLYKRISAFVLALAFALVASAQTNTLTQTTLAAAALASDNSITVTSATGINAPASTVIGSQLYVIAPGNQRGEVMLVQSVSSTSVKVARGRQGARSAFPSGSTVLIGQPNWFYDYSPSAGCTTASTFVAPWVNTKTGEQSLCSTVTLSWVRGFSTAGVGADNMTATVASAAGTITPSGPLFSVSGTAAITGFVIPVGFTGGSFTIIPTGVFTWTNAGNIGLAGTAVVGKALTFTWSATASKFYPSYIA